MKYAMTADGKTAARTGDPSGSQERAQGKGAELRHQYMGIMAGIGPADDPMLNVRSPAKESGAADHLRQRTQGSRWIHRS